MDPDGAQILDGALEMFEMTPRMKAARKLAERYPITATDACDLLRRNGDVADAVCKCIDNRLADFATHIETVPHYSNSLRGGHFEIPGTSPLLDV